MNQPVRKFQQISSIDVGGLCVNLENLKPNTTYYMVSYFNPKIKYSALHIELLDDINNINKDYPIHRLCGVLNTNTNGYPKLLSCNLNQP